MKMCGICGFNWEDKGLVKKMADSIAHRGADDSGTFTDNKASLGHRRLSILDLSKKGHQPMSNEEGTIWIVYNGEIYNFLEIREELEKKGYKLKSDTDTEVILYSYQEWGEKCLEKFNGMFSFCIYDTKKKLLFLARDRIGIKPLYYYHTDGKFIFGSEIKCILKHDIDRHIDQRSLNTYMTYRSTRYENTIFKDIKRLENSSYLLYDLKKKRLSKKRYWDVKENIIKKKENEVKKDIINLLEDSVKKRLISDVPLGAYLSGGIDSSAIVSMMAKIKKDYGEEGKIKTFSVAFEYGEKVNELQQAKELSRKLNCNHTEFVIKPDIIKILPKLMWHYDEPFADPAAIPVYELSKRAKKKVTVVLTGDGGDELFAGYDHYKFFMMKHKIRFTPSLLRKIGGEAARIMPNQLLNKVYKYSSDYGSELKTRFSNFIGEKNEAKAYDEMLSIFNEKERKLLLKKSFTDYEKRNNEYFSKRWNYLNKLLYYDLKNLLSEEFLMKTDRATMAWGVEARVPLLDHRMVELSYTMPTSLKLKGKSTKYIFKKSLEGLVPKETLYRPKQAFHVPMDRWIEKDLMKEFKYLLDKSRIEEEGLLNHDYVKSLFKGFKSSRLYRAKQLWNLVCFETWYDQFIKR